MCKPSWTCQQVWPSNPHELSRAAWVPTHQHQCPISHLSSFLPHEAEACSTHPPPHPYPQITAPSPISPPPGDSPALTPDHYSQPGEKAALQDQHEQGQGARQHQPQDAQGVHRAEGDTPAPLMTTGQLLWHNMSCRSLRDWSCSSSGP